jgi:hypothetical protein
MASKHEEIEQILQTCLDEIQSGQETLDSAAACYPELRSQLEAALWLRARSTALAPRPGFVAQSRQRLVAQLEVSAAREPPFLSGVWGRLQPLFTQKRLAFHFVVAMLLMACLVLSSTGLAAASQGSIPGDTLYPVKITLEKTQLVLSLGEEHRAELHLQFAERRLVEIQNLVIENRFDQLHNTINAFEFQAKEASRLLWSIGSRNSARAKALAGELGQMLKEQTAILPVLLQATPQGSKAEISRLIQLTAMVALEARNIETKPDIFLTPTVTPTLSTATLVSPTPQGTATLPVPTPLPVITLNPFSTPMPETPMTGTPMGNGTTGTPAATVESSAGETPQPIITEEPVPTRRPTKTKKPLPDPPRRPPKPTRRPR